MISVSIIGHNEEKNIEKCLQSVKWADEIIFVDCASIDKTVEINKKYTDKIFSRENNPNLNINKQYGIDQCKGDWILYLDPDEIVTEELKKEILSAVQQANPDVKGYLIPRKNIYFGKFLRFGGKYPDNQLRLFKKGSAKFQCESVHERISVDGAVLKLKSPMTHYPYSSISDMLKKSNFYTSRRAEYMHGMGDKPGFPVLKAVMKFKKAYFFKLGFLDGFTGLVVSIMDAYNVFISQLKLKEIYENEKK